LQLGYISLLLAFVSTAFTLWASATGIRLKDESLIRKARLSVYGQFFFVSIAVILLIYALVTHNFSLRYVAEYTDRKLPLFYAFSALWAGQAGSLLFWTWLLTIFNAIFVFKNRQRKEELHPYVFAITSVATLFFLILVVYSTNPFEKLPHPQADGFGLNPLLQNFAMIFHPPTLFLGFVGFTIPFAFALAALMKGDLSNKWLNESRNWSLFAWIFLTVGNLLGAQWAYVELGWGGYWAWDPVENASLLPWLTGTALVHSIMAQRARNMMKGWSISLAVLTFLLTILGTFITRSGIISSVHAFEKSNLGILFIIFMSIILIVFLALVIYRRSSLKSEEKISNFLSREFIFLLLNSVMIILMVTILWGTMYPAFTELFVGHQITLGEQFFNKISIPFGIILLLLIAICPLFLWRETPKKAILKKSAFLSGATIIFMILLFVLGIRHIASLLTLGVSFFGIVVIFTDWFQNSVRLRNDKKIGFARALWEQLSRHVRRYAAYLIHLGVILIFIAIVGTTAYKQEKQVTMKKGDSTTIGKYTLTYENISQSHDKAKDILLAHLSVFKNGKKLGDLTPQRFFYRSTVRETQVSTEVSLRSTLLEDLYISLASFQKDESATFVIMINPLQNWMWIGGGLMTLGIIIIFIDIRRRRKSQTSTGKSKNKINKKQLKKK